jgi:adenine-specific DNA-methyltransferase
MQRLELTWIGKGEDPAIEPRILLHDTSKDYGDPNSENMLIHGDNLLALKALEQDYAGRVKCIYIDPPYNTASKVFNKSRRIFISDSQVLCSRLSS